MKTVKRIAKEVYRTELDMVIILAWFLYQAGVII